MPEQSFTDHQLLVLRRYLKHGGSLTIRVSFARDARSVRDGAYDVVVSVPTDGPDASATFRAADFEAAIAEARDA